MTDVIPAPRTQRDRRAEILSAATELFIESGYEATSLREIAQRLDVTKAALYYHFRSKEDILRALLEPIDELIEALIARLQSAQSLDDFADVVFWTIDMKVEHTSQFRLLERNRHAIRLLNGASEDLHEHLAMHARVRGAVHRIGRSTEERVRLYAALGAVTAFDDWAPGMLRGEESAIVQRELRAAVVAILRVGESPETRTSTLT